MRASLRGLEHECDMLVAFFFNMSSPLREDMERSFSYLSMSRQSSPGPARVSHLFLATSQHSLLNL